ncbi:MAG: hypothetical protein QOG80_522 [Pseudonocardiales bacterium]|jgi:hypothetical protein|nr:hypothetical protein [Pseudonocardiales bacterium]
MDVEINEVHSTIDTIDRETLLSPEILARIVAAVRASLRAEQAHQRDRAEDVDVRSVVEQQRAGRR